MSEAAGPEEDDAAQAFEALRTEVAKLRQGIELVYRQGQEVKGVDYSLTLGQMAKALQAVEGRLQAVESKPALQVTPEDYRRQIDAAGRVVGEIAAKPVWEAARVQNAATAELKEIVGRAREKHEQRAWLASVGAVGVMVGLALWMILVEVLPGGAGTWLAALPLAGGDRWQAGAQLMRAADPAGFSKIVQLSQACGDQPAALCAAAIAVGTAKQAGQSGSEPRP